VREKPDRQGGTRQKTNYNGMGRNNSKNNTEKPQTHDKRNKNKFTTFEQPITTENRFTLLSNLEEDNTESTLFQNQGEQAQIHKIHKSTKQ